MTILSNLKLSYALYKRRKAACALEASLRPDPESRAKRLSQWSRVRQQRYFDAAYGDPQSLRK